MGWDQKPWIQLLINGFGFGMPWKGSYTNIPYWWNVFLYENNIFSISKTKYDKNDSIILNLKLVIYPLNLTLKTQNTYIKLWIME